MLRRDAVVRGEVEVSTPRVMHAGMSLNKVRSETSSRQE